MIRRRGASSVGVLIVSHLFSAGLGVMLTCLLVMLLNNAQQQQQQQPAATSFFKANLKNADVNSNTIGDWKSNLNQLASQRVFSPTPNFGGGSLTASAPVSSSSYGSIEDLEDPSTGHLSARTNEGGTVAKTVEQADRLRVLRPNNVWTPTAILPPLQQEQHKGQHEKDMDTDGRTSPSSRSCGHASPTSQLATSLSVHQIVFGIASSSVLWEERQEYVKLWWKPGKTRGYVFLDKELESNDKSTTLNEQMAQKEPHDSQTVNSSSSSSSSSSSLLPEVRISENMDNVTKPSTGQSEKDAMRISRIVSEIFRMGLSDVAWFVLGDDDTIFCIDNLVRVLSLYDHNQMYYLGSSSESLYQNTLFSLRMAFGGAGVAISTPLVRALASSQDRCLQRNGRRLTSDSYLHACISELGIQMTKVDGFHQMDLRGDAAGLLESHPIVPFVSVHHLSAILPLLPGRTRLDAAKQLVRVMDAYPLGFLQQSVCFDSSQNSTISVAWGLSIHWNPGWHTVQEMSRAERTFLAWNYRRSPYDFSIDTRDGTAPTCNIPAVFHVASMTKPHPAADGNLWVETEYRRDWLLRHLGASSEVKGTSTTPVHIMTVGEGSSRSASLQRSIRSTTQEMKSEVHSDPKQDQEGGGMKSKGPSRRHLLGDSEICPKGVKVALSPSVTVVKVRAPVLPKDWAAHPRRQCCKRVELSLQQGMAEIELGPCADGEVIAAG